MEVPPARGPARPVGDAGSIASDEVSSGYLILVTLVATAGGLLFGYDTMIITGALPFLRDWFSLDAAEKGWAVSSIIVGSCIGTFIAGAVSDFIGRKRTMILAGVLFGITAIGTAIPKTFLQFSIFRMIGGFGIGIAMVVSPIYIAEIAPPKLRGTLVSLNQFVIVGGALIAATVGYFLASWPPETNWRWMFASEGAPTLCLLIGLFFIPESPRWLIKKNRTRQALDILTKIGGKVSAEREAREIEESICLEAEEGESGFAELFRGGALMALIVAVGLAVLQQLSGGQPLTTYAPLIFERAGFPIKEAIGITVLIFVWSLICVVIVCWLVERMGRRPLLLGGIFGMAIGHLILALCFAKGWFGFYMPIILILTIGMSNLSISPLAWVVLAEIFPTRIRGRAMGIATFILFVTMFAANQTFPSVQEFFEKRYGSPSGIFLILAGICFAGVYFMYRMVPETKGKTLEEISNAWIKHR